ncbi:MAG: S-layer homology domain-containing protein [Anaerovoracaceae bacterium]
MDRKLRGMRKLVSVLVILCMLTSLAAVTGPVLAAEEDNSVKLTEVPSILWGGYGRYVEYEMDGVKYRTDEATSAVNREAWNRMSDEDRKTTYKTLYTTTARKAAFGENGYAYIKHWTNQSSEWYEANKIWKERVAKRTFPELQPIFNGEVSLSNLYEDYEGLKNYVIPANISTNNLERKAYVEAKDALEQHFAIGKEYYQKAVDLRAKSIGTAVSFTAVQCTQMFTDMLFVPSVVQGATMATSGMIADVTNVLMQVVGADGGSLVEKLGIVLDGGTAHLTVGEQVHLYASYMRTYAKLAENSKTKMDAKIGELRAARDNLNSLSEALLAAEQEKASKKEEEQASYKESIEETFVTPDAIEPGDDDDVNITLAFNWKAEEELKRDLFDNNFDQWLNDHISEDTPYLTAAEMIFDEVMAQKSILDHEVTGKVNIISGLFMEAYNDTSAEIATFELELKDLKDKLDNDLPDYNNEATLYRIPVGGSYFDGTASFSPKLENYYGQPYDSFYDQLSGHILGYQTKVEAMLETVDTLKGSSEELYNSIEVPVQNVVFYLNLLKSLEENYLIKYNSVVWKLHNDTEIDPSVNYENNPYYINPFNSDEGEAYRKNGFSEAFIEANLPEELYDPDITIDEFAEALAITRPTSLFEEAYAIYMELSHVSEILTRAHEDCIYNENAFKDGRTNYYEEMDAWLSEYKTAEQNMANDLAKIKNITDSYESLWEGTYFLGAYDIHGYNPYLYNTELVSISAFDVSGLRAYIKDGGNTTTLYNKLKEIERKAEIGEVETRELIGKIGALDIEMQQLRSNALDNYAESKGTPVKSFYSLRHEYGLDDIWDDLTRDGEDVLYYYNICDIPQICDILKGETDDVQFLRNSIKEIRGYLDAGTVDTVPVSNRLYDIYKKATGIKEVYERSTYLLTEDMRTKVLNMYANPGNEDDIFNTIYDVKVKHEGVNYTYPPSQHEGLDEYKPVGDTTYTSSAPGSMIAQTPIYHPAAVNTRSLNATLFIYGDEWNEVQTLSLTEDGLQGIIDAESDMVNIPFDNLEDGGEYRLDWKIVYGTGSTDYEERSYFFTYGAPVGVFTTVELNETYDSAEVTVVNNSGTDLTDQYVFLNAYDDKENILLSLIEPLGSLNIGETVSIEFTFDEAVYLVEAYVADEDGQTEAVPVLLEIQVGDSFVEIPSGLAEPNTLTFTATVYDQYGDVYEGGNIEWSMVPAIDGISVNDGVVTVTSAAIDEVMESGGVLQCTVTATLSGTGIYDSVDIYVKPGNAGGPDSGESITVASVVGGTAEVTTDKTEAKAGEIVTVTIANIESGKQFKSITVTDAGNDNVTTTEVSFGAVYTFTMPAWAVTIAVELENEPVVTPETYTVTVESTGTGATGAGNYAENEVVTIDAGTRSGYTFEGWTSESEDVTFVDASAQITTFTMPARDVTITANWKAVSSGSGDSGGSSGSSGGGGSTTGSLPEQKEHEMGTETTDGTTTTTIVDGDRLESYVETAEEGSGIMIPLSENETSTAQLPLSSFESMAEKEMTLTILSGPVAIDVPASSIDTDAIKGLLGAEGGNADISLSITIAQPSSDEAASLQASADSEGLGLLGTPVVFNITASYGGKTVEIASFNQYVQRRLEVDKETADSVTTAMVFEGNNTFRPVPTSVYHEGGKHYVVITTRTNSTYVLVSQKTAFNDTDGKWYKDIVKEMADRRIISGIGNNVVAGDREITRAEFAAIMTRALGLPAKGTSQFSDVAADSWYNQAVAAAAQYGIVSGKGDNRFDPLAKITREEAMQIVFNASKLAPINGAEASVDKKAYRDYDAKSQWATEAVDFNLNNGLIVGSNGKINPKANITRGEAATVILKLLKEANLV